MKIYWKFIGARKSFAVEGAFDYNRHSMKNLILFLVIVFTFAGCANAPVYNALVSSSQQTFLINGASLAQVLVGMKQEQVHQLMGDSIIIGYAYQKPLSDEETVLKSSAVDYKPLTINNPYKTQDIKTKNGLYKVEYYVSSVQQPDGVIKEDELVPLVFHEGILVGKGRDFLKDFRSQNPS